MLPYELLTKPQAKRQLPIKNILQTEKIVIFVLV